MYRNTVLLIIALSSQVYAYDGQVYSLDKQPFIHPRIIEDLTAWVSDRGDQVVSINITDSIGTNRYFGEIDSSLTEKKSMDTYHNSGNPYVSVGSENACGKNGTDRSPRFGYDLIGKIKNIYVIHTSESSCGTGVWHNLVFVEILFDKGIIKNNDHLTFTRERQLIKKLGEFPLGDRYEGYVEIRGNTIFISKDGRDSSIFKEDTIINVNI